MTRWSMSACWPSVIWLTWVIIVFVLIYYIFDIICNNIFVLYGCDLNDILSVFQMYFHSYRVALAFTYFPYALLGF